MTPGSLQWTDPHVGNAATLNETRKPLEIDSCESILMSTEFVSHQLIYPGTVEKRSYQESIAQQCLRINTLVCLPTGLGKSLIAVLVIAEMLRQFPERRAVMTAPTRPLVLQHFKLLQRTLALDQSQIIAMTGENPPEERSQLWHRRLVVSTPQILMNDLLTGRTSLDDVSVAIFDEAHRAIGDYPYVYLGERFSKILETRILAMTASPGSDRNDIDEVCRNLHLDHVEIRTITSPDVKPYLGELQVEWKTVPLPPIFHEMRKGFQDYLKEKISKGQTIGLLRDVIPDRVKLRDILQAREGIRTKYATETKSRAELTSISSDLYSCIHAIKAIELLDTQGLSPLQNYFQGLKERTSIRPSSTIKQMLQDERVERSLLLVNAASKEGIEHPKIAELISQVNKALDEGARRLMVFTNYRSTAAKLLEVLNSTDRIVAVRLVGQVTKGQDKGLSQKQQTVVLEDFRSGTYNVLIATQIGEEGLDIAECDEVVFYDNVPSAIRFIQRRGRTGRRGPGKVVILMAEGTRDEAYYWIAKKRERVMTQVLRDISSKSEYSHRHPTLERFNKTAAETHSKPKIAVIVDTREGSSTVVRELSRLGVSIEMRSLLTGDFVLSDRVAVERKTVDDFANSMMDGRLFSQAKTLKESYEKPVLLIEGENWQPTRNVSPEAIMGALASLLVDYSLPVVRTRTSTETALLLVSLGRREQIDEGRKPKTRAIPKPEDPAALQEYIVASLPNVDTVRSRKLLRRFGTVERVFTAQKGELSEVEGIGKTISERVRDIITKLYERKEL